MSSALRKAVYFAQEELYLKEWAEYKTEGFSTYIKRLIAEDRQAEGQRAIICQALKEFYDSEVGRKVLAHALARALDGKVLLQGGGEGNLTEEAATLEANEIDQIAAFLTGR
jgi:hypothetical protein